MTFKSENSADIEPFLELLELEPENLASLKEQLGEFLNQLKSLLDKTSQFSNFYPLFYDVEYIRKGTRSNRLNALLNYDLDMEDKLALQKFLSQFGMDDLSSFECIKIWTDVPYEEKENWVSLYTQLDTIREKLKTLAVQINKYYELTKIFDYWNTLNDYSEFPNFTNWIQKIVTE